MPYNHSDFTEKESGTQRGSDLLKFTQEMIEWDENTQGLSSLSFFCYTSKPLTWPMQNRFASFVCLFVYFISFFLPLMRHLLQAPLCTLHALSHLTHSLAMK